MAFENWHFQKQETFPEIPDGEYSARIISATKEESKTGKEMMHLKFAIDGYQRTVHYYIVFNPEKPEITNRNLTDLFNSFQIAMGNFRLADYAGKVGAIRLEKDANGYQSVKWLITGKRRDEIVDSSDTHADDIPF